MDSRVVYVLKTKTVANLTFTAAKLPHVAIYPMMSVIYGREGVFPIVAPRLTPVTADHLLDLLPLHAGRPPVLPATAQHHCPLADEVHLPTANTSISGLYNTLAKAIIERLYL